MDVTEVSMVCKDKIAWRSIVNGISANYFLGRFSFSYLLPSFLVYYFLCFLFVLHIAACSKMQQCDVGSKILNHCHGNLHIIKWKGFECKIVVAIVT